MQSNSQGPILNQVLVTPPGSVSPRAHRYDASAAYCASAGTQNGL